MIGLKIKRLRSLEFKSRPLSKSFIKFCFRYWTDTLIHLQDKFCTYYKYIFDNTIPTTALLGQKEVVICYFEKLYSINYCYYYYCLAKEKCGSKVIFLTCCFIHNWTWTWMPSLLFSNLTTFFVFLDYPLGNIQSQKSHILYAQTLQSGIKNIRLSCLFFTHVYTLAYK